MSDAGRRQSYNLQVTAGTVLGMNLTAKRLQCRNCVGASVPFGIGNNVDSLENNQLHAQLCHTRDEDATRITIGLALGKGG